MRPWSRRCCVASPLSPIFHRATANQPKVVRQTRRRARPVRALRPLRRPPAGPRRPGPGGRSRPAARPPGDRAARGPHRRLPDGPAGLAGAGPAGGGARLRPDRPGPGAARRRGRPHLPDPRGRLGRRLGPARAGPDRPPLGPGPGAQRPVLPRLRRPVGQHLDQPRRLPRGRPAARRRGRRLRPVPGPGRVAHRAGPAGLGPRRPGRGVRRLAAVRRAAARRPGLGARRRRRRRAGRAGVRRTLGPRPRVAQVPVHRPGPAGRAAAGGLGRARGGYVLRRGGRAAAAGRVPLRRRLPGRPSDPRTDRTRTSPRETRLEPADDRARAVRRRPTASRPSP